MTTAIKQTVEVGKDGKVELQSAELAPGMKVEVIILVEEDAIRKAREAQVASLLALLHETQRLPEARVITDEEIAAEIESHRLAGR